MAKEVYIQQGTELIDILNAINFYVGKKRVINILIAGPPGIGKTFLCEKIAEELGCSYRDITGHPGITREDLEGVPEIIDGNSSWKNGVIPEVINSANKDGVAIFVMNEFNILPVNVQPSLNSYMDHQGKFVLTTNANVEFLVNNGCTVINFATINENIHGVNPIQDSVMSRWSLKINLKNLPKKVEIKVLQMKTGIKEPYAKVLSDFSAELRTAAKKNQLTREISPREVIELANLLKVPGISHKAAFNYTIKNKLMEDPSEEETINDLVLNFDFYNKISGVSYEGDKIGEQKQATETDKKSITHMGSMAVKTLATYKVESLPKSVEYKGKIYEILEKGEWCPKDKWVGKIVTKDNMLELHYKPTIGEKKIEKTGVKFIIQ